MVGQSEVRPITPNPSFDLKDRLYSTIKLFIWNPTSQRLYIYALIGYRQKRLGVFDDKKIRIHLQVTFFFAVGYDLRRNLDPSAPPL